MIPANVDRFNTEGEKQSYRFLEAVAKLDQDYFCWYFPDILGKEPDFINFSNELGLVVFEVKYWNISQIDNKVYMSTYVYTVSGAKSEDNAKDILVGILMSEYGSQAGEEADRKGFKRVFASIGKDEVSSDRSLHEDQFIKTRLRTMHANSPIEYMWDGLDKQGFDEYTFWGVSAYKLIKKPLKKPKLKLL